MTITSSCKAPMKTLTDLFKVGTTLQSTYSEVSEANIDSKLTLLQNFQYNLQNALFGIPIISKAW